ncbi:N-alpha-acetyltransferase 15, NatA auxiliary subunit-like isoform X1 [Amphibalanus amphitrite]|uniref:N-alpha-acetyltransferase 15, NatA auxiliary subunit-like isoform X1 n=2 Tax=Amphibalanus amphitrite TaxID=1232801 RepID=UPI001C90AA30|nr:N-alpha-acetyltransferase 15, NatA auxiliary subunit-like isoform X1 [Amphibalanus amphitrite]
MSPSSQNDPNVLPSRENSVFKKIVKCYEHKQYKNGLKFAKQILAAHPDHGETLSMKGLILNCLGKKEEAYDYVRKGLRNNLKSHVCWHVYGILQRSDKKYDEAIKCYRNALKWDKDNIQILRDLSQLQIQMRDLEGYRETRYQLFVLRPTQRVSWIGYALSQHLAKDHDMALSILETFRETLTKDSADYEQSELMLYQAMVIREAGRLREALEHLDKYEAQICDKVTVQEMRAEILLELDRGSESAAIYRALLKRNPESRRHFAALERALAPATEEERLAIYQEYQQLFPRAHAPKKLQLYIVRGEKFVALADEFLRQGLRKGAPPLFTDMSSLYHDAEWIGVIESLVLGFERSLAETGYFSAADAEASNPKEAPSCLVWTYYYLAQHFDFKRDIERALGYIDKALEHTPTLIELFVFKAKIFKHAGNAMEASKWMDEAQGMDTADRYINSKAAKYMLRANMLSEAEELCSKFTREGVQATEDLNNMQCMWYLTETARAYQRLGRWGDALKKCHEVDRHFSDIIEDQFDFNTYCLRRMTIRSYVGLLRLEDILRRHPFYYKAAQCAIEVYLLLHDKPPVLDSEEQTLNTENLSPEELKKLRSQQRKARKKERQEQERKAQELLKKQQQQQNQRKDDQEESKHDELQPDKLVQTQQPLEEAAKLLQPLLQLAQNNIETHLMAFEIYYRKGRILLMLRALKRALALAPDSARLAAQLVRFRRLLDERQAQLSEPVRAVLAEAAPALFGDLSAQQLADRTVAQQPDSLEHVLQGARMMFFLDKSRDAEAVKLVSDLAAFPSCTWQTCRDVLTAMLDGELGPAGEAAAAAFRAACAVRFPYCAVLGGALPRAEPTAENNGPLTAKQAGSEHK